MSRAQNYRLGDVQIVHETYPLRMPYGISGREIQQIGTLRAHAQLIEKGKRRGVVGTGEAPLVSSWAWPSKQISGEQASRIIVGLSREIAAKASSVDFNDHPVRFGWGLLKLADEIAVDLAGRMKLAEPIPPLAVQLAAAPVDAAVHDAFARTLGISAYAAIGEDHLPGTLADLLGEEYVDVRLTDAISLQPQTTLSLYHTVGLLDPLTARDQSRRVEDGRPETLGEWLESESLSHLAIKLRGNDLDWDVGRLVEIERLCARFTHTKEWRYTLDFNEACTSEDYVIDFLERIDRLSRNIGERVDFIDQPTTRQLALRRDITMHRVSRLMSVAIDESLTDLGSLRAAHQLGYDGVTLRPSRPLTLNMIFAAIAISRKMKVYVQSQIAGGAVYLQTAALAAHVKDVRGVEAPGRQYLIEGQEPYASQFPPLFRVIGGTIPTELLSGEGLGFANVTTPNVIETSPENV